MSVQEDRKHAREKRLEETIVRCITELVLPGFRTMHNDAMARIEELENDRRLLLQYAIQDTRPEMAQMRLRIKALISRTGRREMIEDSGSGNGHEEGEEQ